MALAQALEANAASSKLASLNLQDNETSDAAAAAFGRALAAQGAAGALRTLSLACNQVSSLGVKGLSEGLRVGASPLEDLDLSGNPITDKYGGFAALGAALGAEAPQGARGLRTLRLTRTKALCGGVVALLRHGLRQNSTISCLVVSHNGLKDEGVLALAQWVAEDRFAALGGKKGALLPPPPGESGGTRRERSHYCQRLVIDARGNQGVTRAAKDDALAAVARAESTVGVQGLIEFNLGD